MMEKKSYLRKSLLILGLLIGSIAIGHPIDDYYKLHKNDTDMESRTVPPKMAALMVDEDYPEAIDVLKSLSALKYLNYWGDNEQIKRYASQAISAKGNYKLLLEEADDYRNVTVFGQKKKGVVRKLIAVVETKTQFLLLIGKGKLTDEQVKYLPALSKEIK